jgi:hypothetical protein
VGSDWFTDWRQGVPFDTGLHPRPSSIISVVEDTTGRLWVLGAFTPPGWTPRAPDQKRDGVSLSADGYLVSGPNVAAAEEWIHRVSSRFASIVDVVDPAHRQVVASATFPGELHILSPCVVYRTIETPAGDLVIEILTLRLRDP